MFIKVTNSNNSICYVNVANIQYVEKRDTESTAKEWRTLAVIVFGDSSSIRTRESAEDIMELIAKATK